MSRVKRGKIGVYGPKTRALQRRLSAEAFGLTFKTANVYLYLGSRKSVDPKTSDIQSTILFETADRAYQAEPIEISIAMDAPMESAMDFSRFGIINPISDEWTFRVHLDEFECLGRWLEVGDVFEIPFYERDCEKAFWEVTDVDDKISYEKFYVVVKASIVNDSRKTREVPLERTNSDLLDDMMLDMDAEFESDVDREGLDNNDPLEFPPDEPVDYRDKRQASFLDDPEKIFNEDNQ